MHMMLDKSGLDEGNWTLSFATLELIIPGSTGQYLRAC